MLPYKLIYHSGYDLNIGDHVFPAVKFRMIRERMLADGFATVSDFIEPAPAEFDDLLLAHDRGWIVRLRDGTIGYREVVELEIPYSRQMVDAFWLAAGGTILAARCALRDGGAYNTGGGFHHAYPARGEGFCAIHDVAVAVRKMQRERLIERAMVVDCDVHHGNGTAAIFAGDESVFTFSIHQLNNYPAIKPPSTLDIHLDDGVEDAEYLTKLGDGLGPALERFRPQLVMYVAGADPYREDQLGGLNLTIEGLRQRDDLVIRSARAAGAAVAVTLAGGYAVKVEDTVSIHVNTARSLLAALLVQ